MGITGSTVAWCDDAAQNKFVASTGQRNVPLGELRIHILRPSPICPAVLERHAVWCHWTQNQSNRKLAIHRSESGSPQGLNLRLRSSSGFARISRGRDAQGTCWPTSFSSHPPSLVPPAACLRSTESPVGKTGRSKSYRKLQYLLNPRQVYRLWSEWPDWVCSYSKGRAELPDSLLAAVTHGRLVLDAIDKLHFEFLQAAFWLCFRLALETISVVCLRWGGGYEGESLFKILKKVEESQVVADGTGGRLNCPPSDSTDERTRRSHPV
ncbi:hypothetical protein BV898_18729 [Hypsibius exemplaris]|uniref:Uncharacterized protein n=1 Tax=Hypsibius exemplaris TaxID=2072580 RepID=A0A9X6RP43_HYPEX|nr:hypothetical protein BV898_18729 [Hypsibius exemplaris]